jgi:alpha-1,3-rhamnosyl/mannosyltransferase
LTGIGRYTLNLIKELISSEEVEEVRGFDQSGVYSQSQVIDLIESLDCPQSEHKNCENVEVIKRVRRLVASVPGARLAYQCFKQYKLNRHKQALKGFVYWEPNYLLSEFDGASVVTIHDLSHIEYPDLHPKERVAEMERRLPDTWVSASRLQAVSNFTKFEIEKIISPNQPIDIVSPAVGDEFFNVPDEKITVVRSHFELPETFVLSVATFEPRKNLTRLIQAFDQLPEQTKCKFPLVMVGARGWGDSDVKNILNHLINKNQAYILGYVPQELLAPLYAAATISVYVSVYEGFGMPIAESMAAGTPVITSKISSMPEVAGEAAIVVDPYSEQEITQAMKTLLHDMDLQSAIVKEGLIRAKQFTWHNSGLNLIKSLKQASKVIH